MTEVTHSARNTDELPLWAIEPWSEQPRKRFDEAALAELADSIKNDGLLEPIIVRPDQRRQPSSGRCVADPCWNGSASNEAGEGLDGFMVERLKRTVVRPSESSHAPMPRSMKKV